MWPVALFNTNNVLCSVPTCIEVYTPDSSAQNSTRICMLILLQDIRRLLRQLPSKWAVLRLMAQMNLILGTHQFMLSHSQVAYKFHEHTPAATDPCISDEMEISSSPAVQHHTFQRQTHHHLPGLARSLYSAYLWTEYSTGSWCCLKAKYATSRTHSSKQTDWHAGWSVIQPSLDASSWSLVSATSAISQQQTDFSTDSSSMLTHCAQVHLQLMKKMQCVVGRGTTIFNCCTLLA